MNKRMRFSRLILSFVFLFAVVLMFTACKEKSTADKVEEAKEAIVIETIGNQTLDAITNDLSLPSTGLHDAVITWSSNQPSVIASDGSVTRPEAGQPDVVVEITATISIGSVNLQRVFTVTVIAEEWDSAGLVNTAIAQLEADFANIEELFFFVVLPSEGPQGISINWESSDESLVLLNGTVNRPTAAVGDKTVTLTATVSHEAYSDTVAFTVLVKALPAPQIQIADVRDGETYLGRPYNHDFDLTYDAFTRQTIEGVEATGLWWAYNDDSDTFITDYHLQARYSKFIGTTPGAPIYKVASPSNSEGAYLYLVMEMRGFEGASINDLILTFRLNDNYHDIVINFSELRDPDLDLMQELTGEYQTYVIDLMNTLDGMDFELRPEGTGPATIQAGNAISGIHFMSKTTGEGEGVLNINRVYWSNSPNPVYSPSDSNHALLDNFDREVVSAPAPHIWWRDAGPGSRIIGKHLALDFTNDIAIYRSAGYDNSNAAGYYDNAVLRIRGTIGGEDLLISPFYVTGAGDVYGDPVKLSELLGPDGMTLPALTTNFQNFVINFAQNEWDKEVNGFKFESISGENGMIYIDRVFFTNLEFDAGEIRTSYPHINPSTILVFDNFQRAEVGATPNYDPNNQVALDHGFSFIIAYAGINRMSIENDALVFDTTENQDYMQYTVATGSRMNVGQYQYVVFKLKVTDGGSLNHFRIATIDATDTRSPVEWGNGGLKSGSGLNTPQYDDPYPFVDDEGFMFVIVDLMVSNLTPTVSGFDIFFGGGGKLHIDAIFFANEYTPEIDYLNPILFQTFEATEFSGLGNYWFDSNASLDDNALKLDATDNAYSYFRTASYPNNKDALFPYMVITMKGAPGTTLNTFRLETIDGAQTSPTAFFNANHIIGVDGSPISNITEDYEAYIIDLAASGLFVTTEGIALHFGGWGSGIIHIDAIEFVGYEDFMGPINVKLIETDLLS